VAAPRFGPAVAQATAEAVCDATASSTSLARRGPSADRLLGGQPDDDGRERAAEGQRPRVEVGDLERDDHGREHRDEPQEEPDRPRGAGIEPARQRGCQCAADVPRDLPAERDERERRRGPHRRIPRGSQELVPVAVDQQHAGHHREHDEQVDARPLGRAEAQPAREAAVAPGVPAAVDQLLRPASDRWRRALRGHPAAGDAVRLGWASGP
jgi:hypothetical protein